MPFRPAHWIPGRKFASPLHRLYPLKNQWRCMNLLWTMLQDKLGMKPTAIYRPTYSETNDLVRYQQCDIAIVCTYPFIRGEKEFGMQALVVPQVNGETNLPVHHRGSSSQPRKNDIGFARETICIRRHHVNDGLAFPRHAADGFRRERRTSFSGSILLPAAMTGRCRLLSTDLSTAPPFMDLFIARWLRRILQSSKK